MQAIWKCLKRDPFWTWFLPAFIALQLPFLLPIFGPQLQTSFADLYTSPFQLALVVFALATSLKTVGNKKENRFWRSLTLAYTFWWVNSIVFALIPTWTVQVELATDGLYALYYWLWFLALAAAPHRQPSKHNRESNRLLRSAGSAILAVGLLVYFIAVPLTLGPDAYLSWLPSFNLYVVLDALIALVLLRLVLTAQSERWKTTYGLLAITALLFFAVDVLEALIYRGLLTFEGGAAGDLLWNLPFIPLVLAARLRRLDFAKPEVFEPEDHRRPSPLMLSSLVLPVTHIVGYQTGLLNSEPSIIELRELWVLICLLLLGILASIENAGLRLAARQANDALEEARELRMAKAVAERSGQAKGHFLASISHEIRTPMVGILGLSKMLIATKMPSESRRFADLLHTSAKGLLTTVDNLLEYSKIDAGKLEILEAPFSLRQLLRDLVVELKPSAEARGLILNLKVDESVPDHWMSDALRLQQVLRHLLSNAIKFTDQGHITIHVAACAARAVPSDASEISLRLEIEDTGIGIAQDKQDLLFQPFAQEDASSSRRYGGTGLGLAISRRIVDAMGGRIGVRSRPGYGSRFWIEAPFTVARPPGETPPEETPSEEPEPLSGESPPESSESRLPP